jgi:uncharacterized repeat protein (TIGR03803 family)
MSKLDWRNRACAAVLLWATAPLGLSAQTFKRLHRFDRTDGANPYAGMVQATGGNLYGTTYNGGANTTGCFGFGCGTVFKITPSGTLTTLYSFCSQTGCTDGTEPFGGLVQVTDGNFYGTTYAGGSGVNCRTPKVGCGTIFKITPSGTLTTLYSFCSESGCTDGAGPETGLVQGSGGNFYGETVQGGNITNCLSRYGCGTIFKITPSGTLTTLHRFCSQSGCPDGANPEAALVQATDGNFYGTTYSGGPKGNDCGSGGCGTLFKITPSGTLTTLHRFCSQKSGCTDGANPEAALVQATDGNFYGTTPYGGANGYAIGTVFKITPSGTLTTLYSFCSQSGCPDGIRPGGALVQATDGNFYGTTVFGANGYGTIFQITPSGTLTTLYTFCSQVGCPDGDSPFAGLVQDTSGMLYGTTYYGGTTRCRTLPGCGTVFSLSVGLGPFVKAQPASGKVGRSVQILGTNLTGATSVTFNGTVADFKVVLDSLIKTTVPEGATTGTVEVVTPGGTLSSNVPFRVRP